MEYKIRVDSRVEQHMPTNLLSALGKTSLLCVSGRPLIRMKNEEESYYNQNVTLHNVALDVISLSWITIPRLGHRHLEEAFLDSYPGLSGIGLDDGADYIFGIRPELSFAWKPLPLGYYPGYFRLEQEEQMTYQS